MLDGNNTECIGAGRAKEGLRADWQRQLLLVKKQCGFEYIRFHGLLSDDMGVYKKDAKEDPQHNWQYISDLQRNTDKWIGCHDRFSAYLSGLSPLRVIIRYGAPRI